MKKSPNNSIYLRPTHQVFWRTLINYTEKEREKIVSYFPKEKQEAADDRAKAKAKAEAEKNRKGK